MPTVAIRWRARCLIIVSGKLDITTICSIVVEFTTYSNSTSRQNLANCQDVEIGTTRQRDRRLKATRHHAKLGVTRHHDSLHYFVELTTDSNATSRQNQANCCFVELYLFFDITTVCLFLLWCQVTVSRHLDKNAANFRDVDLSWHDTNISHVT